MLLGFGTNSPDQIVMNTSLSCGITFRLVSEGVGEGREEEFLQSNFLKKHFFEIYLFFIPGSRHNFKKYGKTQIDSLNVPYDYGSIMHYGRRSFSNNGRDTIVPKKSGVRLRLAFDNQVLFTLLK